MAKEEKKAVNLNMVTGFLDGQPVVKRLLKVAVCGAISAVATGWITIADTQTELLVFTPILMALDKFAQEMKWY